MAQSAGDSKIRVVIADDHSLFREMLMHTLSEEEDIEVVGQAVDGKEAFDKTCHLKPDILLLDISMPRQDGIETTRKLSEERLDTKIVILTAHDSEEFIFQLVQAGAVGYLMKDTSSDNVVKAIRSAYNGESLIQPRIASKILKELSRLMGEKVPGGVSTEKKEMVSILTERESEILSLVGSGLNNREIATKLVISEATVKTHVMNTMHKLNLRDRVEMALFAVQSGMVLSEGCNEK